MSGGNSHFENSKETWNSTFLLVVPKNKYYPTYGSLYSLSCPSIKKTLHCEVFWTYFLNLYSALM